MEQPLLSIIIPAYNEENRLPNTLGQVFGFLSYQDYTAEVLVVENGSRDNTLKIAQSFAREHPGLTVLQEPLPGKGSAVRKGMLAARGQYRFMCDADLSMPSGARSIPLYVRRRSLHAHRRGQPLHPAGVGGFRSGYCFA